MACLAHLVIRNYGWWTHYSCMSTLSWWKSCMSFLVKLLELHAGKMELKMDIILLFLILTRLACRAKGAQTHDEILAALDSPNKLVFDVTKPMSDNLLSDYFNQTIQKKALDADVPSYLYYEQDGIHYDGLDFIQRQRPSESFMKSLVLTDPLQLHFLFERQSIKDGQRVPLPTATEGIRTFLKNMIGRNDSMNLTIIFKVGTLRSVNDYRTIRWYQLLSTTVDIVNDFKAQWAHVKVGLQLDARRQYYATPPTPELTSLLDELLLNVNITKKTFLLSYSKFKSDLRLIIDLKLGPKIAHPNLTIYIKLNFLPDARDLMPEELYQKYLFYFLQFCVFWLNDGEPEALILEAFNTSLGTKTGLGGVELKDLVGIDIRDLAMHLDSRGIEMVIDDHISSNFKSVSIGLHRSFENPAICQNMNMSGRSTSVSSLPQVNLIYDSSSEYHGDPRKQLIDIKCSLPNYLPWKTFTIEMMVGEQSPSLSKLVGEPSQLPMGVVPVCSKVVNTAYDHVIVQLIDHNYPSDACSLSLNHSSEIVWDRSFPFAQLHEPFLIMEGLTSLEMKLEEYRQHHPERSLTLSIIKPYSPESKAVVSDGKSRSLYCDSRDLKGLQITEAFIHFAKLHNLPVEWKSIMAYPFHPGGWSQVQPSLVYFLSSESPVLVARNFPDKFLLGELHTDPCISWTGAEEVMERMEIDPVYAGTTVYLSDAAKGPMTEEEINVLLLFVFNKFTHVEIIPGNLTNLNTLLRVMSRESLAEKRIVQVRIMINCQLLNNAQFNLNQLLVGKLNLAGIHFSYLENCPGTNVKFIGKLKKTGLRVGAMLEECVAVTKNKFDDIRVSPLFPLLDYLVCNIQQVVDHMEATNVDKAKVENYLDVTYYIKKYYQRVFPEEQKELIFRLNVRQITPHINDFQRDGQFKHLFRDQMSEFLKFFSDVNQYARLNRIKMFMLPAFDDMLGDKFGWWRIQNFSDLANASVFIDKESEYQGRETLRPTINSNSNPDQMEPIVILLWSLAAAVIVLTVAALLLRAWNRRKSALLNSQEVDYFFNGCSENGLDEVREDVFDNRKFPPEFEIKKERIILCNFMNMIGKGNFGLVYRTNLSNLDDDGSTTVAVKIPHPGCSKELFKSMLSELKVLCYVGCHENVLEFVGAYVAEIGRGVVSIVTELCENGCLQEYLRKLYTEYSQSAEGIDLENGRINRYELYRFAHEIAKGMEFIASKHVIHGDLSTRNVLLDMDFVCKIGDFGLSRKLYDYQEYVRTKGSGTALPWRWLAIESLKQLTFSTQSDVWSYGITLWEIFSLGNVPYPGSSWTDEFVTELENGYRMPAPAFSSPQIYGEMGRCWQRNPAERPTFTELCQFFRSVRDSEYV